MKVYRGGYGPHQTYVVANAESEAIQKVSDILGIPYLPVTAEEVTIHGYDVQVVPTGKGGGEAVDPGEETEGSKPKARRKQPDQSTGRTGRARKEPDK